MSDQATADGVDTWTDEQIVRRAHELRTEFNEGAASGINRYRLAAIRGEAVSLLEESRRRGWPDLLDPPQRGLF